MEETVKQRLIEFIKHLGIGQTKFERTVGLSNGYVNNIAKSIGTDKLQKILCAYPTLNHEWLLTGEGSMERNTTPVLDDERDITLVPYYRNVEATMGCTEFADNPNEDVSYLRLPGFGRGVIAVNATGDSMYPLIKSGEVVLITRWTESFIEWGKIYLVITSSGYHVIKRLYPSADPAAISCHSENKDLYPPFDIPRHEILYFYLVKGWISQEAM